MPSKILWDANPGEVSIIAASGVLKNLANNGIAISPTDIAGATNLNTYGHFRLYVHDFAAAPTANGWFELHLVPLMGSFYGDGEDGDLAGTPNLTSNTWAGNFPVKASDEDQHIPLTNVLIPPFDFRCVIVNKCGQAIANSDGSTLTGYFGCEESQ